MSQTFEGFPKEGIQFLRQLKRNNNRDWFLPRKHVYEEKVRAPMIAFLTSLREGLLKFAPEMDFDPKKAVYHIYRDVRFSQDKSPYKAHIAASIRPDLPCNTPAGLYIHVEPKEVFVAGGLYMPGQPELSAIRKSIAADYRKLRKILQAERFRKHFGKLQGEQLSRAPRGISPDHPALDLLRYKQFLAYEQLPVQTAYSGELTRRSLEIFRAVMPMIRFLNKALGAVPPSFTAHRRFG